MDILDRNAKCPLCGKFYHRWSIHRNPIPTKKDQRAESSLCQCEKGKDAREFRNMKRMEIQATQDETNRIREETLGIDEKNRVYWRNIYNEKSKKKH